MSSDRRRKVHVLDEVKEPRQIAADTANELSEPEQPIRRRRKSLVSGTNPERHRIYEHIPAGWVPRLVSMEKGRPQKLYEQDWEFIKGPDGNHIYETVNSSKGAQEVRHVWMMKREEFYLADAKEKEERRNRALQLDGDEINKDLDRRSGYFKDVGLSKDDEFLYN